MISNSLSAALGEWTKILGADAVSQDPDLLEQYGRDWTRWIPPRASVLLRPSTPVQVAQLVEIAARHKVALVPSGGRTGLAGGAVAHQGEAVVTLERINHLEKVDALGRTVRVGAGAITAAVHEHCAPFGLIWPVDFASKGSSQVGGNIATNAGGVRVIRHGLTRNWVLGLQVVTARGEILELGGALEKNNTGIDLRQLFIGSEGILGIITEAVLKLAPIDSVGSVYFLALRDLDSVFTFFERLRRQTSGLQVSAFEMMDRKCVEAVSELDHRALPFDPQTVHQANGYVLLELADTSDKKAEADFFERALESGLLLDARLAQNSAEILRFWGVRERIAEAIVHLGRPHKNDIALPIHQTHAFLNEFSRVIEADHPETELYVFGHLGDGNLHINQLPRGHAKGGTPSADFEEACKRSDLKLFELVKKYKGSVSAEHGIGLLKKEALPFSRTVEELNLMRAIKAALDPDGLFNPGKVL